MDFSVFSFFSFFSRLSTLQIKAGSFHLLIYSEKQAHFDGCHISFWWRGGGGQQPRSIMIIIGIQKPNAKSQRGSSSPMPRMRRHHEPLSLCAEHENSSPLSKGTPWCPDPSSSLQFEPQVEEDVPVSNSQGILQHNSDQIWFHQMAYLILLNMQTAPKMCTIFLTWIINEVVLGSFECEIWPKGFSGYPPFQPIKVTDVLQLTLGPGSPCSPCGPLLPGLPCKKSKECTN